MWAQGWSTQMCVGLVDFGLVRTAEGEGGRRWKTSTARRHQVDGCLPVVSGSGCQCRRELNFRVLPGSLLSAQGCTGSESRNKKE